MVAGTGEMGATPGSAGTPGAGGMSGMSGTNGMGGMSGTSATPAPGGMGGMSGMDTSAAPALGTALDILRITVARQEVETLTLPTTLATIVRNTREQAVNQATPRPVALSFRGMQWLWLYCSGEGGQR